MSRILVAAFASAFLLLSGAAVATASPIDNGDGSQTCNASGPSGDPVPGVCANDLKTNEEMCDGGLSTEPGGGITCSEPNASSGAKVRPIKRFKAKAGAPGLRFRK